MANGKLGNGIEWAFCLGGKGGGEGSRNPTTGSGTGAPFSERTETG